MIKSTFTQSTLTLAEKYQDFNMSNNLLPLQSVSNKVVLITGASGFLALNMINDLVLNKDVEKIICLVRDRSKFNLNKQYYKLNFDESKLVWIIKDLIDLNESDLIGVDRVIHNAAQIHALKSFSQLKKNNVDATLHLYKMATITSVPISLISTLSVWVSSNQEGVHTENLIYPSNNHLLYGGYAQTKWLVEHLAPKGTQIYRLGLLTADSSKGIFPEKDFFSSMVKVLKELQVYPRNYINAWVDISPVDIVSEKIVNNLGKNAIINIANKKSYSLNNLIKELNLKSIDNNFFKEKLNSYSPMLKLLIENAFFKNNIDAHYFNVDLFQATNHFWDGDNLIENDVEKLIKLYINKIGQ